MIRLPLLALLLVIWASCSSSSRDTARGHLSSIERAFVLEISENRTDTRENPLLSGSQPVSMESISTLFGRVVRREGVEAITFFADSIRYQSKSPYIFNTFMSADTMYYSAPGGGSAIDPDDPEYAAMLSCLFDGPALWVTLTDAGTPSVINHSNDECRSGEYKRMNAPVTLAAFLNRVPAAGEKWYEMRSVPSFSSTGFHPEIEWYYRTAEITAATATVTVAADSTIENHTTVMPNGEEVRIVSDRFRVGGTLVIDREAGLPAEGELRISESLHFVRPRASGMSVTREGRYTIRFELSPLR
jgi:hypothetical protein